MNAMKSVLPYLIFLGLIILIFSCDNSKQSDEQKPDGSAAAKARIFLPALITDFENAERILNPPFDGSVFAYTDENENPKGTSTINELIRNDNGTTSLKLTFEKGEGADKSDRFLKISGDVTADCPFGFVGCGINLKNNREPVDLSGFKGIKFWAKGTADSYVIRIENPLVIDYAYPECRFFVDNEWEEFVITFDNFRQPSWKSAVVKLDDVLKSAIGFQWQTNSRPLDNYVLCLDNIEFIK